MSKKACQHATVDLREWGEYDDVRDEFVWRQRATCADCGVEIVSGVTIATTSDDGDSWPPLTGAWDVKGTP